jgi:hypothetical protein
MVHPRRTFRLRPVLSLFCLLVTGCGDLATSVQPIPAADATAKDAAAKIVRAPDNSGITLPEGSCATLVVDGLGLRAAYSARHIGVAPNNPSHSAVSGRAVGAHRG